MSKYDYYENEKQGKRPRPAKKGGWLGKIVCLFLGLILGVIATIGGVVGVGYWVANKPLKEPVKTLDKYIDADLYQLLFGYYEDDDFVAGILNEQYADMSMIETVQDIGERLGGLEDSTMKEWIEVSPIMENFVDDLIEKANDYAVPLNKNEVLTTSFKQLGSYVFDAAKNTPLGDLITAISDEPLNTTMLALAYGERDVDFVMDDKGEIVMLGDSKKTTIDDLMSGDFMGIIGRLPLSSFIEVDTSDEVMMSIMYGSSSRYTVDNGKVEMKQVEYAYQPVGKSIDGYRFFDDNGEEIAYVSCTPSQKNDTVLVLKLDKGEKDESGAPIYETQYLKGNDNGTVSAYRDEDCSIKLLYKKTLIKDLEEDSMSIIDGLVLGNVLGINADSNKVLRGLAYGLYNTDYYIEDGKIISINSPRTIGDLRNKGSELIDEITLSDVISGENPDDKIVMYLLYGKQGIHFETTSKGIEMLQRRVAVYYDNVSNSTYFLNEYGETTYVLEGNVSPTIYTEKGVDYKIVNGGLDTLNAVIQRGEEDKITVSAQQYYLTDMQDVPVKYKQTTLGDLSSKNGEKTLVDKITARLSIGDVVPNAESNKLLKCLMDCTIDNLSDRISTLTVGEVFAQDLQSDSPNKILKHLADSTVVDIPSAVENLTFGEVFFEEITKQPVQCVFYFDETESKYYVLVKLEKEDQTVLEKLWVNVQEKEVDGVTTKYYVDIRGEEVYEGNWIDDKGCKVHFAQAIEEYVDANGNQVYVGDYIDLLGNKIGFNGKEGMAAPTYVSGVWKYLLQDPENGVIHGEYKLANDMTKLTDNMIKNIHDAHLYDLKHDDILQLDTGMLDRGLTVSIKGISVNDYVDQNKDGTPDGTFKQDMKLGELTTEDILVYVDALLQVIDIVNSL